MRVLSDALVEKVLRFVDQSGGPDACHPWTGLLGKRKPVIWFDDLNYSPRRVLFLKRTGIALAPRQLVLDLCGNQQCCNPLHLYGGTAEQRVAQLRDDTGGPDACWPWRGFTFKGYGRLQVAGRGSAMLFAHRVAYEMANGKIEGHVGGDPELELIVMHTCDNPPCCNPAHLRLGTDADNMADCRAKGRNSKGPEHAEKMRLAKQARLNMQRLAEQAMRVGGAEERQSDSGGEKQ